MSSCQFNENQQLDNPKTLFITVGTTKFDALISTVLQDSVLSSCHRNGIHRIILQIGRGKLPEIFHSDIHLTDCAPTVKSTSSTSVCCTSTANSASNASVSDNSTDIINESNVHDTDANNDKSSVNSISYWFAESHGISLVCYRFKPSITKDMKNATFIIGHAGAGTIIQALKLHKKMLVVVNTNLMNNHQLELAQEMADRKHVFACSCKELEDNIVKLFRESEAELVAFPISTNRGRTFARLLCAGIGIRP